MNQSPVRVLIASPLETHHVAAIRAASPSHVEVIHEPDLLPSPRYIADHIGPAGFRRTAQQESHWQSLAASADISFDFPYTDRSPRAYAPDLKWVQTTSSGVGQMIRRLEIAPGELLVTTASGVHARPLTEFVFMVLLMAVKQHDHLMELQRKHTWERFCGDELSGKTLAIVGPGRIGREIARIARAFDMRPVALGRDSRPGRAQEIGVDRLFTRDEFPEMLRQADALVLCAPHTPETESMMDAAAFDTLKPGVVLINIGRGPLIDEDAMLARLRDGTIRFAGLDVFRNEPLPPESAFWDLPNVLINPHSASTSVHENGRTVEIFLHNLACYLDGRHGDMRNVLDMDRMY